MSVNPLAGLTLAYLIGADDPGPGAAGVATVVPYDWDARVAHGETIGYCNLYDEYPRRRRYGPYLKATATAKAYREGVIKPLSSGWVRNLDEQFGRRRKAGFNYVELDNPDGYEIAAVIDAIERAAKAGLRVIAKNPLQMGERACAYLRHPNIYGAIVERDCGWPGGMDELRRAAGKPDMPVWFVGFGDGWNWAMKIAKSAEKFAGMSATYSPGDEYSAANPLRRVA